MKKNSKKKKLMAAAAALALIAAISGTFAWITAQDQRVNRASSSAVVDDSVTINENWEPKPLVAGTTAKKEVSVSNTGTANVFVRVSYEEVLKHLTEKGAEKYDPASVSGAKYVNVVNDPGLAKHMPINFNGAKAFDDGFKVVPAAQITGLTTPGDDNVKLLVKGTRTVDPSTGAIGNGFEAKLVHEYYTDPANAGKDPNDPTSGYDAKLNKYQKMTYNVSFVSDNSAKLNAHEWNFALTDVKYGYYENGYKNTVVNWAKSSLPNADGIAAGATGNEEASALLGTAGKRYNTDYDYKTTTLGISAIPAASVTTNTAQIPTAAGTKAVQADTSGLSKSAIKIDYAGDVVDQTGLAAATNNWIYNEEDGWFYYTQPLKSGDTTADLLKSLVFEDDMGTEYTNASYDLVVKMEAVQATKAALTDSAGWNLDTTVATHPITNAICAKLAP